MSLVSELNSVADELVECHTNLKNNLINKGIDISTEDKLKQLIDKISAMPKGVQFASGEGSWKVSKSSLIEGSSANGIMENEVVIPISIGFEPTYVFCTGTFMYEDDNYQWYDINYNATISNIGEMYAHMGGNDKYRISIPDFSSNSIRITGKSHTKGTYVATVNEITKWYAIGVDQLAQDKSWANGNCDNIPFFKSTEYTKFTISSNMGFVPSKVVVTIGYLKDYYGRVLVRNGSIDSTKASSQSNSFLFYYHGATFTGNIYITNISNQGFDIYINTNNQTIELGDIQWYACK